METNNENSNSSSDQPEVVEAKTAAAPLLDILDLMKKEDFEPAIPDAITEQAMQAAGCNTTDPRMTKLISLAAQSFVSVVAREALQHYKLRGSPNSFKFKGKDGKVERHNTLVMEDLVSSVNEQGMNVRKPPYFV